MTADIIATASAAPDIDAIPADVFERVIRALDVAYFEWNAGSDAMRVSAALADMFGLDPNTWSSRRHLELMHPADVHAYRAAMIAYFKSGKDRTQFSFRVRNSGGAYRWVLTHYLAERDAAGRVTRLTGTVSDITEAKEREAQNRNLIAREAASIEVLKAISASPDDPQPVFELIARRGRELCNAAQASVTEYDGELLHLRARDGYDPTTAQLGDQSWPQPPNPDTVDGRVALSGEMVHVRDLDDDGNYAGGPHHVMMRRRLGSKSLLGVPLLRDGRVVGTIAFGRAETGGFDAAEVALVEAFAEQAVIAIASATTLGELRARTTELARRNSEYGERIEQQSATIDVLKVMSASPGDARPVFELIVERARAFCEADRAMVALLNGDLLYLQAHAGMTAAGARDYEAQFPRPADAASMFGRAILARSAVQTPDVRTDPQHFARASDAGSGDRSIIALPLMRSGTPIGAIAIGRERPGEFSATQLELLRTFAEQAVIAIGSAETYRELQARTAELAQRNSEYGERIDQQSATIDVLKAMSASSGDAQPVFELIAERASAFCEADGAAVALLDGDRLHLRTHRGFAESNRRAYEARFPLAVNATTIFGRAILAREAVQVPDIRADHGHAASERPAVDIRSVVGVPMLRAGTPIGVILLGRRAPGDYSETQVELLQTFAEQAVIAIGSAETYRELQARTAALAERNSEYGERIAHQSATIDVLKAMSASPGDARPVFELIVERARAICDADYAMTALLDDEMLHLQTHTGMTVAQAQNYELQFPRSVKAESVFGRAILSRAPVCIPDSRLDPEYGFKALITVASRSLASVPMLRAGSPIGAIALGRYEPGDYSAAQMELLQTFAEQAVIALGSAETYRELQARTAALAERNSEYGERIEHQSATIDVLKAMSSSPDDTQPVFDLIARRAQQLCNGASVGLFEFDGSLVYARASSGGNQAAIAAFQGMFPMEPTRGSLACRAILDRQIVHIPDMNAEPGLLPAVRDMGARSTLSLPLLRDNKAIGAMSLNSKEVGGFSDNQIELLKTFAEQAVIAVGSAETFRELRYRTAALTRSVTELQALEEVLRAVNSSLDLETVLATIISRAVQLSQADEGTIYEFDATEEVFVPKAAFGMAAERVEALRERRIRIGETPLGNSAAMRAPLHIPDLTQALDTDGARELVGADIHALLAVPLLREDRIVGGLVIRRRAAGGFAPTIPTLLQTFAGQSVLAIENARLFQDARRARTVAEAALVDLRRAQDRLVQSEKMASLGQLTAGIAHEIKNPLNFVNNFSDLSVDLLDELHDAVAPDKLTIAADLRAEIDDLTATLKSNLEKIAQHGRRADSIVKNMLLHSRSGPSEHRAIDLNTTVEEALNLAYHGARAETPGFNITLEKELDPQAGTAELYPQEFIRVMLNLIGNGFYAARNRANRTAEEGFEPTLRLATRDLGEQVEIRVRDNGTGISDTVRGKIFEPFFTTKPAGEGTGLGLSLSYDIVVKQHGGQLTVDSQTDAFTEFVITLPRRMPTSNGGRP
jgi:two-component system, NtrC family, sensor kinase